MKKILLFMLFVTIIAAPVAFYPPSVQATANGVTNPGLETDVDSNSRPDGWSYEVLARGSATLVADNAYSGEKSVLLSGTDASSRAFFSQWYVPATANTRYHASMKMKTSAVSASFAGMELTFYDASHNELATRLEAGNQGTHDWETVELNWESPPATAYYTIRGELNFGSGAAWFDSIAVYADDHQNELANGNLETDVDANGSPDGWAHEVFNGATASLDTTVSYQSSRADKLVNTNASSRAYISQWYIPAKEFTRYQFSAYLKTTDVVLDSGGFIGLDVAYYDESHNELGQKRVSGNPGTHDWQQIVFDEVSPAGTAVVTFRMALDFASGTAWYDKAEMVELPRPNLLNNGAFDKDADRNGTPDRWDYSLVGSAIGTTAFDTGNFIEGSGSVSLSGVDESSRAFANQWDVPVEGGEWYRLSVLHKTDNVHASFVGLEFAVFNSSNVAIDNRRVSGTGGTHGWNEISITMRLPEDANHLSFRVAQDFGSGTTWFDDARLEKIAPRPNLIVLPLSGLIHGIPADTLSLQLKNTGTAKSSIDSIRLLNKTLTFVNGSQMTDGTATYTFTVSGNLAYDSTLYSKSISLAPGQSGTLTINGSFAAAAGDLTSDITIHERKLNADILHKVLNRNYGTLQNQAIVDIADDIMDGLEQFDAYLDTLKFSGGWKTYRRGYSGATEDPGVISDIYRGYMNMYDITGSADYLNKAILAADQLVNIQQPNGGFVFGWDYTAFGENYLATDTTAVDTAYAMMALIDAYERLGDPDYLSAIEDGMDYFLEDEDHKYVWLDEEETRGTVPYWDMRNVTIEGKTGPSIEIYNVDTTVMYVFELVYQLTGDTDLVPYIEGFQNNLEYRQDPDTGGWPYGWRFESGGSNAPYTFVQALDLSRFEQLRPSAALDQMILSSLGYLAHYYPAHYGSYTTAIPLPVLERHLADQAGLDMTNVLLRYINNVLGKTNFGAITGVDTVNGAVELHFLSNALIEAGYTE